MKIEVEIWEVREGKNRVLKDNTGELFYATGGTVNYGGVKSGVYNRWCIPVAKLFKPFKDLFKWKFCHCSCSSPTIFAWQNFHKNNGYNRNNNFSSKFDSFDNGINLISNKSKWRFCTRIGTWGA